MSTTPGHEADPVFPRRLCKICNAPATFRCSSCQIVWYCGREHQKQHWKDNHKETCKGWIEVKDDVRGVHYVANGDLKPGTRLFDRRPILIHPNRIDLGELKSHLFGAHFLASAGRGRSNPGVFPCLGCHEALPYAKKTMDPDTREIFINFCKKCTWPIHNDKCRKKHEAECKIFVQNKLIWPKYQFVDNIFIFVGVLRAILLKKNNSPDWTTLMNMPFKTGSCPIIYSQPDKQREADECFAQNVEFLQDFILKACKLEGSASPDEIETVYRIIRSNGFLCNDDSTVHTRFCHIIFEGAQGRVFSHSCMPNCMPYIHPETFVATFKTILPVKSGEILTINYHDLHTIQGQYRGLTMKSRLMVQQIDFLCDPCTCPRCSDPTENGTMFSAVRCPDKSCKGYLLPIDVKSIKQDSIWACNDPKCGITKTLEQVENEIVILAAREINSVRQTGNRPLLKATIKDLIKWLHPNNYKIFVALWLEIVSPASETVRKPDRYTSGKDKSLCPSKFIFHQEYLEDFEYVLNMIEKLTPGRIPGRGYLEFSTCLLRMSKLAEDIKSEPKSTLEGFLRSKELELKKIYELTEYSLEAIIDDPIHILTQAYLADLRRVYILHTKYLQNVVAEVANEISNVVDVYRYEAFTREIVNEMVA